jgi:BASS family bile acid:Na+ symporter
LSRAELAQSRGRVFEDLDRRAAAMASGLAERCVDGREAAALGHVDLRAALHEEGILPVAPLVSVLTITLICASIIGGSAEHLKRSGGTLLLAVFLLHAGGFGLGYLFARLMGYGVTDCRTVSIEVGMQNSGLGAALAKAHFATLTLAPVPCAVSATFHSVIGSILAGYWRMRSADALPTATVSSTAPATPPTCSPRHEP